MKEARILIVEDELLVALDLSRALERLGYSVVGRASETEPVLEAIERTSPDLVLMDISLKGELDGISIAAQISGRYNIPIVFLSGHSDIRTIERAQLVEPQGFLVKPYRESELQANLKIALYKHQLKLKQSLASMKPVVATYKAGSDDIFADSETPSNKKIFTFFKNLKFFESIDEKHLLNLSQCSKLKTLEKGEILSNQLEDSYLPFALMQGKLYLRQSTSPNRNLLTDIYLQGDIFGLFFDPTEDSTDLSLQAPENSQLILVPSSALTLLLNDHPILALRVAKVLSLRLRDSLEFSRAMAHDKVQKRLAQVILKLIQAKSIDEKSLKINRKDLADMVGANLDTIGRSIKSFELQNIISLRGKQSIQVVDHAMLEQLAIE